MRMYKCDRCGREVDDYGDLFNFDIKTCEYTFMISAKEMKKNIDLCRKCNEELEKLKKKITQENKKRIVVWCKE